WYYLGTQNFRKGKLTDAIAALRSGIAADPKNVEMVGLLAESLLRQGASETDEKKAGLCFEDDVRTATQLKTLREDSASLELLGRSYLASKNFKAAEANLSRALETSKKPSAVLYFNLGFALAQTKTWTRAAEMFVQADKQNPGDLNTLYYLGFVLE